MANNIADYKEQERNEFLVSWEWQENNTIRRSSLIINAPSWNNAKTRANKYKMLMTLVCQQFNINPQTHIIALIFYHTGWKENVKMTLDSINNLKPNNIDQKITMRVAPILPNIPNIKSSDNIEWSAVITPKLPNNKIIAFVSNTKQQHSNNASQSIPNAMQQHSNNVPQSIPNAKLPPLIPIPASVRQHSNNASQSMLPTLIPIPNQNGVRTLEYTPQSLAGYPNLQVGDKIYNGQITISRLLGIGSFATVFLCHKMGHKVTVKVMRHGAINQTAGEIEAYLFKKMLRCDGYCNSNVVQFYHTFEYENARQQHTCLVLEPMGQSLFSFLQLNKCRGFWHYQVKQMAKDLFTALNFCHNIVNVTHGDIETHNVFLVFDDCLPIEQYYKYSQGLQANNNGNELQILSKNEYQAMLNCYGKDYVIPINAKVRLTNFEAATLQTNNNQAKQSIGTRQYRAPEIIVGEAWHHSSDIWSMGCVLTEIYTGSLLFNANDNMQHLALIEKVTETEIPNQIASKLSVHSLSQLDEPARKRRRTGNAQDLNTKQSSTSLSTSNMVTNQRTLKQIIDWDSLSNLVSQCLQWLPQQRITAQNARTHPFFN